MLISRRTDGLLLVAQREHARIARVLADAWGNDAFPRTPGHGSLAVAALRHDDGWERLDGAPVVNAAEGRPAHFLEVPLPETVAPYGEGVDAIYPDDRYAGILASRHWAGLYSSRWGMQESPPVEHPLALEVVEREEARAQRETRVLWRREGGLRSALEAQLWRDYELLQALDLLSLALCLVDNGEPTPADAADLPVPATLRPIDQPPGARLVESVPAANGSRATLRLRVVEPAVVEIDPYPLARAGLGLEIAATRMADAGVVDAAAAYHAAPAVRIAVTLVPPPGSAQR